MMLNTTGIYLIVLQRTLNSVFKARKLNLLAFTTDISVLQKEVYIFLCLKVSIMIPLTSSHFFSPEVWKELICLNCSSSLCPRCPSVLMMLCRCCLLCNIVIYAELKCSGFSFIYFCINPVLRHIYWVDILNVILSSKIERKSSRSACCSTVMWLLFVFVGMVCLSMFYFIHPEGSVWEMFLILINVLIWSPAWCWQCL